MKAAGEKQLAAAMLKLLLNGSPELFAIVKPQWEQFLTIALTNGVLLRVAARLKEITPQPANVFFAAKEKEQHRARRQLELIQRISEVCSNNGIKFLFAKAFQHYPDMGRDLDLFVLSNSAEVDTAIMRSFDASPLRRDLWNRLGGTTGYRIEGFESPLDIHHGRLGALGEHHSYLEVMVGRSTEKEIAGDKFLVPSPEDKLILQAMQKVYGRRFIRMSDMVYTINSIRKDDLDWGYIINMASWLGIFHGLCCYLGYVNQIHSEILEADLLNSEVKSALILNGWGKMEFKSPYYRFPNVRIASRLYSRKFQAAILAGDLNGASRLCFTPLAAVATVFRRTGILNV